MPRWLWGCPITANTKEAVRIKGRVKGLGLGLTVNSKETGVPGRKVSGMVGGMS